jgi:hypothetical protein
MRSGKNVSCFECLRSGPASTVLFLPCSTIFKSCGPRQLTTALRRDSDVHKTCRRDASLAEPSGDWLPCRGGEILLERFVTRNSSAPGRDSQGGAVSQSIVPDYRPASSIFVSCNVAAVGFNIVTARNFPACHTDNAIVSAVLRDMQLLYDDNHGR